jgi:myo-inositol-1(or 4)-monophosphatase
MDYYAVCIALAHKGTPVLGAVYRPPTGELFWAWQGEGAWFKKPAAKKLRLQCKPMKKTMKECLFVTGFSSEKGVDFQQEFDQFKDIMLASRGIRRMGSAALDLCYVATGIFDGFWERGLSPWDVAASGIICLESGLKVTDYEGRKFHPFQDSILAGRAQACRQIKSFLV